MSFRNFLTNFKFNKVFFIDVSFEKISFKISFIKKFFKKVCLKIVYFFFKFSKNFNKNWDYCVGDVANGCFVFKKKNNV